MARRNMVTFEADDALERLIDKRVRAEQMKDRSDYLRFCVLFESFMAGDLDAVRLMAESFRARIARRFGRLLSGSVSNT